LPASFTVRFDKSDGNVRGENSVARFEVSSRNLECRQILRDRAFFKRLPGCIGRSIRCGAPVNERGRFGGKDFLGFVDLGAR